MQRPVQRLTVGLTAAALMGVGMAVPTGAAVAAAAEPSDLIISEYVEGSSFNKAIELVNPTDADIPLAAYSLEVYFNGSATVTPAGTFALTGTVGAGDAFVFADEDLAAFADQVTASSLWNGDDAIVLKHDGAVVDSLGQVGFDPGSQWGTGLVSTQDNTLRRNASVCLGDTDPTDEFDPAVEWTGFAQDTFDGLGAHTADCGDAPPTTPVINEFSASTTGTDVEYVEVLGAAAADLSAYAVLEIEGDSNSNMGVVDEVIALGTADADGRYLAELPANALENGTMSLLLVEGFTGAAGDDLDANDDGVLDDGPGLPSVLDSVAVNDGGAGDLAYGDTVLGVAYDGLAFAPGGASRIPDGTDTDSPSDWVRNDFDLAGIPGFAGTLIDGEAVNTPGAVNALTIEEPPVVADCEAPIVTIGSVQGSGASSPVAGQTVEIEGVVTGDFQVGGFDGYYVQDLGDGDSATSDGVFVSAPGGADVEAGDLVHVVGEVGESFGMTQVVADAYAVCDTGAALPRRPRSRSPRARRRTRPSRACASPCRRSSRSSSTSTSTASARSCSAPNGRCSRRRCTHRDRPRPCGSRPTTPRTASRSTTAAGCRTPTRPSTRTATSSRSTTCSAAATSSRTRRASSTGASASGGSSPRRAPMSRRSTRGPQRPRSAATSRWPASTS
ncbi:hypothetical protein GCM10025870_20000 [Agromyces marinus]|uniref:LTD domain-containing protein n=1 Tax=Agromyces marinus TaxID=1389020 RepID=A0ABN6YC29_9MICO|nr:hypothetical protein GCM10025870_20000 [Agromyces marinus]